MVATWGEYEGRGVYVLGDINDTGVEELVHALSARDIEVFSDQSVASGTALQSTARRRMEEAAVLLVVLGPSGWSDEQHQLVTKTAGRNEPVIPVMVGSPSQDARADFRRRFDHLQSFDLDEKDAFERLIATIRGFVVSRPAPGRVAGRFEEIVSILVDGSDTDRATLLERVIDGDIIDEGGLADELGALVRTHYSASSKMNMAVALRDPNAFASIRSWMLSVLIWLEPAKPDTAELVLEHLDEAHEPERMVRFWALAGIIQRNSPIRDRAIQFARRDPSAEVANLADLASGEARAGVERRMRAALKTRGFENSWNVLRALRIVAAPALVQNVIDALNREEDGRSLTYDALLALSHPGMAAVAASILPTDPGYERLVSLVLETARSATLIARRAFARLLATLNRDEVGRAFTAVAGPADRVLVRRLLGEVDHARDESVGLAPLMAGYVPDTIDVITDDIGIGEDVETLASVILAKDVVPPLAIGLFGEWGSGKTFFMRSIDAAAKRLATRARDQKSNQFCSDIVQIHYNAWHYVDTSLWASLVNHLLDGLSAHLAPVADPAVEQAALTLQLDSVKADIAAASAERDVAAKQLAATSVELRSKIVERERSEVKLRDLRARDFRAVLEAAPQLQTNIQNALRDVGAPAALDSVAGLNRAISQSYSLGGRAAALVASILKGGNVLLVLGGIALILLSPPAFAWLVAKYITPHAAFLSALAAQIVVVAGTLTGVVGQGLKRAKTAFDTLAAAKKAIDDRLTAMRQQPSAEEVALEDELAAARAREHEAAKQVTLATARATAIEERLAVIENSRSLGYFIAERSKSDDYRQHLGLISMVRRDFEGLVRYLREQRARGDTRVDRIILYIDDVDRCPPEMVVDILQAVHLLLAFELFVVVVSVDPRWLLRSLETKFDHLNSELVTDGSATPQDYLEKIFQIPFTVRPMDDLSFDRMMRRLLAPTDDRVDLPPITADASITLEDIMTGEVVPAGPAGPAEPAAAPAPPIELAELARAIAISTAETDFAGSLHALLETPRSAKRFANIYRLLKASSSIRLIGLGGSGLATGFEVPMLLLAAVVGDSASAAILFPEFVANARAGKTRWWVAGKEVASATDEAKRDAPSVAALRRRIAEVAEGATFPRRPELVVDWIPRVARFSFLTARVYLDAR